MNSGSLRGKVYGVDGWSYDCPRSPLHGASETYYLLIDRFRHADPERYCITYSYLHTPCNSIALPVRLGPKNLDELMHTGDLNAITIRLHTPRQFFSWIVRLPSHMTFPDRVTAAEVYGMCCPLNNRHTWSNVLSSVMESKIP